MACTRKKTREKHPLKVKHQNMMRYVNDPEGMKVRSRASYSKHREARLLVSSLYYLHNRNRILEQKKQKRHDLKKAVADRVQMLHTQINQPEPTPTKEKPGRLTE